MNNDAILPHAIHETIKECNIHIERIESALNELQEKIPLTADNYCLLLDEDVRCIDQFIYRYTKLQDKIGSSLLKNICELIEYTDDRTRTFIDILNILEKREFIQSSQKWRDLRNLRNRLSHEYSENFEKQVQLINEVFDSYKYLKEDFDGIVSKIIS